MKGLLPALWHWPRAVTPPCPFLKIVSLMHHVLTKNNFSFMGKNFLQVHGTTMGTQMKPSMACLFLSQLEQRMLVSAPCRPWVWWPYIDDIFFV